MPHTPPSIHWESHCCLRLNPQADFAPIELLRAAGVNCVSINSGMDMRPLPQASRDVGMTRDKVAQVMGSSMVRVVGQIWHPVAD